MDGDFDREIDKLVSEMNAKPEDLTPDQVEAMRCRARSVYAAYDAYIRAGFDDEQALALVMGEMGM